MAAELMMQHVDPTERVLVTRQPARIVDLADRGADVRWGDCSDPSSLADVFAGGHRMLLISTDIVGERLADHKAAIDAARDADVRQVSYTSLLNPTESHPATVVPDHRQTEEHLPASALEWTFLRNGRYAESCILQAQAAGASGTLSHNYGAGRMACVTRADRAAAAAAVLTGGEEHSGQAYDITGPDLLGAEHLASWYSDVGGGPVRAVPINDEEAAADAARSGLSPEVAEQNACAGRAIREGHFDALSTRVADLIGRQPPPLRALLESGLTGAAWMHRRPTFGLSRSTSERGHAPL